MKQPRGVDGAAGTILAASRDERIARAVELHRQGLSQREIGLELGVTQVSAGRFLRAAGVATNPRGARPKYPAPEPRACEHCETVFTPAYPSLAVEPHGRFCSEPCRVDGLRKHEKVGERTCANANCGRAFTPHPGNVQRGRGIYCSEQCSYRSETRRAKIAAVALTRTVEAWRRGEGIARAKVERSEGTIRRYWKLRWAPKPGRSRNDASRDWPIVLERVRELYAETNMTERALVAEYRKRWGVPEWGNPVSKRVVRIALGRPV